MKAVIVNCFDTYEDRVDLIHEFFKKKKYEVTVIQSDFRHFNKKHREDLKEDFIFVKSKPYYKNLSVDRLLSHYKFAKNAFKIVQEINPDLLYVFIPPNSLTKFAAKYKKKNNNVKLIFDLIDLWPETMPIGKAKNFPPLTFWGAMRDQSLKYADLVITECDLYQTVLQDAMKDIKSETLYLAKKEIDIISNSKLSEEEIHLAYLGSINNIIDIPKIRMIIESLQKYMPTTLHIIGDGESKDFLIKEINEIGAKIVDHGKIYDSQEKQSIFDICHFGINIMKDSVCVGLTMKSIDYLQHGLPILNNIQADTSKIVLDCGIGVNLSGENINLVSQQILQFKSDDLIKMRTNALKVFKQKFSQEAFEKKLNSITERIGI